jgi:Tol biopolymer transport system component
VIRRDGASLRQLTDGIGRDRKPYWSPDGKQLVFFSNQGRKWEIWVINSDGSGLQQLTDTANDVTNAVWAPDGTRLAYRNRSGVPSIMEIGKSWQEQSPEALPSISDLNDWYPWSWSRDGRKLAGFRVGANGPDGVSVYSLESKQFEKLTNFGRRPVWLSDSRRMLFQDLRSRLYLLDSQSKRVREILSVAPHELGNGVTVSRDDRLIYFSLITTEADIWLMTLE